MIDSDVRLESNDSLVAENPVFARVGCEGYEARSNYARKAWVARLNPECSVVLSGCWTTGNLKEKIQGWPLLEG